MLQTCNAAEEYVYESLKAARRLCALGRGLRELLAALNTVLKGLVYLSPDISSVWYGYLKPVRKDAPGEEELTTPRA